MSDLFWTIGLWSFVGIPLGIIYFLPSMIAISDNRRVGSVLFLNILFGWTALGWFAAAALAIQDED